MNHHRERTKSAATIAEEVYGSTDADEFYREIWGGEDIHVGLYEEPDESIVSASRRTLEHMVGKTHSLGSNRHVVDLGSGYCGPARFLAGRYGCTVLALNVSEVQNQRAERLNRHAGLAERIRVTQVSFEEIPAPERSFDLAWSQEALLHSDQRGRVFAEVGRVLRSGGEFLFTDPMRADNYPLERLWPVLERLRLPSLASPAEYRRFAEQAGLSEVDFEERTEDFVTHYSRVLEETERRYQELSRVVNPEFLERTMQGLHHWIDEGGRGHLVWGIFQFRNR
jgi:sarcosine/dimethylglycine N-methyltransferase